MIFCNIMINLQVSLLAQVAFGQSSILSSWNDNDKVVYSSYVKPAPVLVFLQTEINI